VSAPSTRLVLWRHGVTDWNATGRFQGQADIPLNRTGLEQARRAAPALAALRPDALYSSPLRRAHATAEALAALTGLPIELDERLCEINVGSWAGLTTEQASKLDPGFAAAQAENRDFRRSPTGETAMEAAARVGGALEQIADRHPGQTVVVVGHGVSTRMSAAHLLGWGYETAIQLRAMDNTGWTILQRHGTGWRLAAYNVTVTATPPEAPNDNF
jgi:probable phosphoglycerate mutase